MDEEEDFKTRGGDTDTDEESDMPPGGIPEDFGLDEEDPDRDG